MSDLDRKRERLAAVEAQLRSGELCDLGEFKAHKEARWLRRHIVHAECKQLQEDLASVGYLAGIKLLEKWSPTQRKRAAEYADAERRRVAERSNRTIAIPAHVSKLHGWADITKAEPPSGGAA